MAKQRKLIENRKPRAAKQPKRGMSYDSYEVLAFSEEFKVRLLAHPNGPAISDPDGFELMTAGCAAERAVFRDEQFMNYVLECGQNAKEPRQDDFTWRMKVAKFIDWFVKALPLWYAWKAKQVKP